MSKDRIHHKVGDVTISTDLGSRTSTQLFAYNFFNSLLTDWENAKADSDTRHFQNVQYLKDLSNWQTDEFQRDLYELEKSILGERLDLEFLQKYGNSLPIPTDHYRRILLTKWNEFLILHNEKLKDSILLMDEGREIYYLKKKKTKVQQDFSLKVQLHQENCVDFYNKAQSLLDELSKLVASTSNLFTSLEKLLDVMKRVDALENEFDAYISSNEVESHIKERFDTAMSELLVKSDDCNELIAKNLSVWDIENPSVFISDTELSLVKISEALECVDKVRASVRKFGIKI